MGMEVRFWGTRGSFPAPGASFVRYGGDTSCVVADCGGAMLAFDAGSGLARFGASLPGEAEIDLFLSHLHLDHVMGLAFFDPIWRAGAHIRIWLEEAGAPQMRAALERQFAPPFHPVALAEVPANVTWRTYRVGAPFSPKPGIEIVAAPLIHPGGANGFRVRHGGVSMVYGADTGALSGAQRADALAWARGADLAIFDSTFTCAESEAHRDWGHMSWSEAAAFGIESSAARVALYHHGPTRTDEELDQIAREAAQLSERVFLARDGLSVVLE